MNKQIIATGIIGTLLGGTFGATLTPSVEPTLADSAQITALETEVATLSTEILTEQDRKIEVMSSYFIAMERLKEPPVVDLALGDSLEWNTGYVRAADSLGIKVNLDSDVPTLINNKLSELAKLCSNPNSTK